MVYQDSLDVAIIGMAGRFPGAKSIQELWKNLKEGTESITFFTNEELLSAGIDPSLLKDPNYIKASPVIEDFDTFDAKFFGISPREATILDPQHRLILETSVDALEDAGCNPDIFDGRIGVYMGSAMNTYFIAAGLGQQFAQEYIPTLIGSDKDFVATRVSFKLNLTGPSLTVQTACSTSLVAVHLAYQSLLNGECDAALAGGVSLRVPHRVGYMYEEGAIFSPDGHCRPFDAKAQGTIFGSGVGIVVLKRIEDAINDNDHIYAVIKGSAINNDGSSKADFTAPSIKNQSEVIAEALASADVEPETIGYIEAHGTGTNLGDPIEIEALSRAFRAGTDKKQYCAIGSVKSNMGHLDAAAGVTGLIKTALSLHHRMIPPSLHFDTPNSKIDFANCPFFVNKSLREWEPKNSPLRAGISSLGIGGTNAHIILEEAPKIESSGNSREEHILLLSAKTAIALATATTNLVEYLKQHREVNLADVAYTLQTGRKFFDHCRYITVKNHDDAISVLDSMTPSRVKTATQENVNRDVVFLFPGQGSQYVNMGLDLYRTEIEFQTQVDHCSELLKPHLKLDLRDILYPNKENTEDATEKLRKTLFTQPALFVIEYALAKLWVSWGVQPTVFVGHSIGEYVAACLADVFTLEEALRLVATRGRLTQDLPGGSMLAVPLPEAEILPYLNEKISLAAINSPTNCVVSGEKEAILVLEKQLSENDTICRQLHTSHAFHSNMVEPILDEFTNHVKQARLNQPQIPIISTVTGARIDSNEITDPSYWTKNLRQTVRFSDCATELLQNPTRIFLEVGPGQTLSNLTKQHTSKPSELCVLSSLRHPKQQKSDVAFILDSLGHIWLAGGQIDWFGYNANEKCHHVPLPTYPFERQRYWLDPPEPESNSPVEQNNRVQGSILDLLNVGKVKQVANELIQLDEFSEQEAKLVPKLLEVLVEKHQHQMRTVTIQDLLYEVHWKPQIREARGLPAKYLPSPEEIQKWLLPKLEALMARPEMQIYEHLTPRLEALSINYVLNALWDMGWNSVPKERFTTEDLAKPLGVLAKHQRLLHRLLEMLEEGKLLRRLDSQWEVVIVPERQDSAIELRALTEKYTTADTELALLGRCGAKLSEVLRGECDPLELLFPEGDLKTAVTLYRDSPVFWEMNTLVQQAVVTALSRLPQGKGVRILEIGGGTGGTTSRILPELPKHRTDYVFTDVSPLFTTKARERFSEFDFVRYELLDIGTDPEAQGFNPHQYDLIVASNVLHATTSIRKTIEHVQKLLVPGGLLVLLEGIKPLGWIDLFAGGLEGWWMFTDTELRPSHPLMPAEKWRAVLQEGGFEAVEIIDPSQFRKGGLYQQAVIVAQLQDVESEEVFEIPGQWLVLADAEEIAQGLMEKLEEKGEACVIASPGKAYAKSSAKQFSLNPQDPADFRRLLNDLKSDKKALRGVIHMWGMGTAEIDSMNSEDLEVVTQHHCTSTLYLVQALIQADFSSSPSLWLVTRGAQPVVMESGIPGLTLSPVWGIGKVISLEHPELKCARIDLDPIAKEDDAIALFNEILSKSIEDQVAFRDNARYVAKLVPSLAPIDNTIPTTLSFSEDKSYLIIGGLGGVGFLVAKWMVEKGARNLILSGRRGLIDSVRENVKELEQAGCKISIAQADVANQAAVTQLLADIEQKMPPLRGIIHSALVLDDGVLYQQTQERFARVMAPKVKGAWNLHILTRNLPLDFFVLFSSITSVLGNPGQSNYVAANSFLDAFAHYRKSQGLPGLCVNWGFLLGVGEASRRSVEERIKMRELGIETISAHEALQALELAMLQDSTQVGVLSVEWDRFAERHPSGISPPLIADLIGKHQKRSMYPKADQVEQHHPMPCPDTPPSDDAHSGMLNSIKVEIAETLGISESELDVQKPLNNMGLDSLMAVGLRNRFKKLFGVDVSLAHLIDGSSIADIVTHFDEKPKIDEKGWEEGAL